MAKIKTTCPNCGDIRLNPKCVTVRVYLDDDKRDYLFVCTGCSVTIVKTAERRLINQAVAVGATVEKWSLPAEPAKRTDEKVKDLDQEAILELRTNLQDDEAVAEAIVELQKDV